MRFAIKAEVFELAALRAKSLIIYWGIPEEILYKIETPILLIRRAEVVSTLGNCARETKTRIMETSQICTQPAPARAKEQTRGLRMYPACLRYRHTLLLLSYSKSERPLIGEMAVIRLEVLSA